MKQKLTKQKKMKRNKMTQNNKPLHETEDPDVKYYEPKPEGEKAFWKKHLIDKIKDRNGNDDDIFNGGTKKDKTRQPADPKADLEDPSVGNRPVDELKGEKGAIKNIKNKIANFKERYGDNWKNALGGTDVEENFSDKQIKMASGIPHDKRYADNMTGAVKTIEKIAPGLSKHRRVKDSLRAANEEFVEEDFDNLQERDSDNKFKKDLYVVKKGDQDVQNMIGTKTRNAVYARTHDDKQDYIKSMKKHGRSLMKHEETDSVFEDSQAASSDNPGGTQPGMGTVDNNNSHLNNNPTSNAPKKGNVKDTLEKIAMQCAELHDSLEDGQEIDSQAQALLGEAKDALDQVYEMVNNGGGDQAQTNMPTVPVAKGGKSANVKEEFEELEEATVKDNTDTIIGTHHAGAGFKPNALGKKLGHTAHPTDVPKGTTITKRGRKVGSKSFGASKRGDLTSVEAGSGNYEKPSFTDQLLHADDSVKGGPIKFENGETHHVPRPHVRVAIAHISRAEKYAGKKAVIKHMSASKENFDTFRKSGGKLPEPKAAYDPDAKLKARTATIISKTPSGMSVDLKTKKQNQLAGKRKDIAGKILAMRKATK